MKSLHEWSKEQLSDNPVAESRCPEPVNYYQRCLDLEKERDRSVRVVQQLNEENDKLTRQLYDANQTIDELRCTIQDLNEIWLLRLTQKLTIPRN